MHTLIFRKTTLVTTVLVAVSVLLVEGNAQQQNVPLSQFEGTWVGLQTWTIENPSAEAPQIVTLTLEMNDGSLTGTMTPFLGMRSGATITEARVIGNELHATARAGTRGWQGDVGVAFTFSVDADSMKGNADLTLGDIDWLKFDYDLNKKRSRY